MEEEPRCAGAFHPRIPLRPRGPRTEPCLPAPPAPFSFILMFFFIFFYIVVSDLFFHSVILKDSGDELFIPPLRLCIQSLPGRGPWRMRLCAGLGRGEWKSMVKV